MQEQLFSWLGTDNEYIHFAFELLESHLLSVRKKIRKRGPKKTTNSSSLMIMKAKISNYALP